MRTALRTVILLIVLLPAVGGAAWGAEAKATTAAATLFENGADSVSFQLADAEQRDLPSPEKELLHRTANQQAIAELLKEERNKMLKPGLSPPDDKDSPGIKIRFDGVRFLRDERDPDLLRVRLVGPVNEVENKTPLSMRQLLESESPIPIRFESVTRSTGVTVTISTDARLKLEGNELVVSDTRGTFDFSVGRFSPARLLYSSDSDSVALPTLRGKRVSNDVFPVRSFLEPEKL